MLKLATRDDVDRIMPLFKKFQEEFTPWDQFDSGEVKKNIDTLVFFNPNTGVILLEEDDNGVLVGFLIGIVAPSLFSKELHSQEMGFFLLPEYRKSRKAADLLKAYEYWAKNIAKVDWCQLACMDDRVGKLYERKGFERRELYYMKRIR